MTPMRRLLISAGLLVALAGCGEPATDPDAPAATAEAPTAALNFTRPTHDGGTFTLADHRGEVVVLNFWATWCVPCLAEMPEFVRLQDELRDQGVQFVGVSQDEGGLDEIRPFAERLQVNYPLLPDPELDISAQFGGVPVLPTTFILNREGAIHASTYGLLSRTELLDLLDGLIDPSRLPETPEEIES